MTALSECGYIPDPNEVFKETETKWLFYMPWYGDFVYGATSSGAAITDINGTPSINTERMSEEFLITAFEHEKMVTWKKLPDFTETQRNLPPHVDLWEARIKVMQGNIGS
jgi:mannan endo-1,4-beta-mannosidase